MVIIGEREKQREREGIGNHRGDNRGNEDCSNPLIEEGFSYSFLLYFRYEWKIPELGQGVVRTGSRGSLRVLV